VTAEAGESAASARSEDSLRPLRARLSPGTWRLVGYGGLLLNIALPVSALGLLPWLAGSDLDATAADVVVAVPTFLLLSAVGALILARVPGHPIGVLFTVAPLVMMSSNFAQSYLNANDPELPGRDYVASLLTPVWILGTVSLATYLPLLFPTGAYLSARWRLLGRVTALTLLVTYACYLFAPGPIPDQDVVTENLLGVRNLDGVLDAGRTTTAVIMQILIVLSLMSLALRFRQSEGVERQQLKWFVAALCVAVVFFLILGPLLDAIGVETPDAAYLFAIALLPLSVAVAILRYRLYEIDYLINRAFVYGSLTAVLAGVLAACLSLFSILFEGIAGGSDAQVVVTALILSAAFAPVKRELQGFADRHFGVQDQSELDVFHARMTQVIEVIDPSVSSRELLDRAVRSLRAAGGAVFLYRDGLTFCVAIHGEYDEDDAARIPIEHLGQELGYLAICPRSDSPQFSEDEREALRASAGVLGACSQPWQAGSSAIGCSRGDVSGAGCARRALGSRRQVYEDFMRRNLVAFDPHHLRDAREGFEIFSSCTCHRTHGRTKAARPSVRCYGLARWPDQSLGVAANVDSRAAPCHPSLRCHPSVV